MLCAEYLSVTIGYSAGFCLLICCGHILFGGALSKSAGYPFGKKRKRGRSFVRSAAIIAAYVHIDFKEELKMKKWVKVLICVLAILLVTVSALAIWQRNNISAVFKMLTSDKEQIAQEMNENKEQLEKELQEKYPSVIDDITAEQEEKILRGELTVEEVVAEINKKYEERRAEQQSAIGSANSSSGNNAAVDRLIGDKVIEIYSLKAYYLGQLGQLEAAVKSDYSALPENKRNIIGKKELVSKYMGRATSLMSQCDSRVESVLSELKSGLESYGADTSIIKRIRSAYENEKALKKAYYMSLVK